MTGTTAAAGQADTKQRGVRPHREPDVPLQEAGPQLQEEQEVWDKIEQELVRQVSLHCQERGLLLSRARSRRAEIMQVLSPPYTMNRHIIQTLEFEVNKSGCLYTLFPTSMPN
jgi:hypothetical protein